MPTPVAAELLALVEDEPGLALEDLLRDADTALQHDRKRDAQLDRELQTGEVVEVPLERSDTRALRRLIAGDDVEDDHLDRLSSRLADSLSKLPVPHR